jgi:hypothetical protein
MYGMEPRIVVRRIQLDRRREAQDNRLVRKARSGSQKQSTFRFDTLTHLARRLISWVQGVALEPAG